MPTTYKVQIQLRYDTYEKWSIADPVLKKGEVAIYTNDDKTFMRAGDGEKNFSALTDIGNWNAQFNISNIVDLYDYAGSDHGLVPGGDGDTTKYLNAKGQWAVPPNTWTAMAGATSETEGTAGYVSAPPKDGYNTKFLGADGNWKVPPNTWIAMGAATTDADGTAGYVPAPVKGQENFFLKGDGTWAQTPDTNTTYEDFNGITHGLVPMPLGGADATVWLNGNAEWTKPSPGLIGAAATIHQHTNNTETKVANTDFKTWAVTAANLHPNETIDGFVYARFFNPSYGTSDKPLTQVNAPCVDSHQIIMGIDGAQTYVRALAFDVRSNDIYAIAKTNDSWTSWDKLVTSSNYKTYLSGEGTFAPKEHTHANFTKTVAGFVPAPTGDSTNRFLREDSTWQVPPDNNTWTAMTAATAESNGVAGYVPAPPKDGYNTKYLRADATWQVPPDTNTTYTLSSFGVTAAAADINSVCTAAEYTALGKLVGITL